MDIYKKTRSKFWIAVLLLAMTIGLFVAAFGDILSDTLPHWR